MTVIEKKRTTIENDTRELDISVTDKIILSFRSYVEDS